MQPREQAATGRWKRKETDSPLEPPGGVSPANSLIFSLLRFISTSGHQDHNRINCCCFKPYVCGNLLQQQQETDTPYCNICTTKSSLFCYPSNSQVHLLFSITTAPPLGQSFIISQKGRCHSLWLPRVPRIKSKIVGTAHMNLLVLVSVSLLKPILHTR